MKQSLQIVGVSLFCASVASADATGEWDGAYAGAALNFSTADSSVAGNRFTYNQNQALNLVEHGYDGAGIGGYAGWNEEHGNLVYGAELSLNWDNLESNLVFNADNDIDQVKINWSGTLAMRSAKHLSTQMVA